MNVCTSLESTRTYVKASTSTQYFSIILRYCFKARAVWFKSLLAQAHTPTNIFLECIFYFFYAVLLYANIQLCVSYDNDILHAKVRSIRSKNTKLITIIQRIQHVDWCIHIFNNNVCFSNSVQSAAFHVQDFLIKS